MVAQWRELSDSQWEVIKEFLPIQRKRKYDLREILNGMFWLLRTGAQWRNLESRFPPWTIVYYYFRRWSRNGLLEIVNERLNIQERKMFDREPSPSLLIIDSQSVKAAPFTNLDRGLDANKKVNGRKRHVAVDVLGLFQLTKVSAADCHDGTLGKELVAPLETKDKGRLKKFLGDQSYRGSFVEHVEEKLGLEVEIVSPPNKKGFHVIPTRWIVERTFGWTNFYRRLVKDYEKTVESSVGMLLLMNIRMIILRYRDDWP